MMTTRIRCGMHLPLMVMILMLALSMAPAMVSAQDVTVGSDDDVQSDVYDDGEEEDDDDGDDNESALQNPSQAAKAERLADAAALNSDDEELGNRVETLEAEEQELERMIEDGSYTEEEIQAQKDVVEAAEQDVAERLAELSGEAYHDIVERRLTGDGWGEIAKDLGLHPSILGHRVGQMKANQHTVRSRNRNRFRDDGEISTTARDVKTGGLAKGHGKSASDKGNRNGKAGSLDQDEEVAKTVGKAKGKSSGKGGGKGNGKGNGKK